MDRSTLPDLGTDATAVNTSSFAGLGANHAILFRPDAGDLEGRTFLVIDTNGVAGYQAGEDMVIHLRGGAHLAGLDVSDFTV